MQLAVEALLGAHLGVVTNPGVWVVWCVWYQAFTALSHTALCRAASSVRRHVQERGDLQGGWSHRLKLASNWLAAAGSNAAHSVCAVSPLLEEVGLAGQAQELHD